MNKVEEIKQKKRKLVCIAVWQEWFLPHTEGAFCGPVTESPVVQTLTSLHSAHSEAAANSCTFCCR